MMWSRFSRTAGTGAALLAVMLIGPVQVAAHGAGPARAGEATGPQVPAAGGAPAGLRQVLSQDVLIEQLLALTNQARVTYGCPGVTLEQHLADSAQAHTEDMGTRRYFSHTSWDGTTFDQRIRDYGYGGQDVGENIASGYGSALDVQAAWMNSPGHRDNILDCNFGSVGIGYDPQGGYWTVDFGG